jgi:hypothetical protein
MMHLEWHLDKLNDAANELAHNAKHRELTEEEIVEFKQEFTDQIRNLQDEVSSLGGHLTDAVNELYEMLPKCEQCDEILTEDNIADTADLRDAKVCADCQYDMDPMNDVNYVGHPMHY